MRILISAGEASSDVHGAELLKALRAEIGNAEPLHAFGIGGPRLQEAGLEVVVDSRELMVMGFVEVLRQLPKILKVLNRITRVTSQFRPDVAVVIDYPGFHFRLARRLKKMGIPTVYYIPPKVWVWRQGRVRTLKKLFKKILVILPFEQALYEKLHIPVKYVGNPLIDELPLHLSQSQAREQLSLRLDDRVIVLLVGSRESEWNFHFELFLEATLLIEESLRKKGLLPSERSLKVLMPFPATAPLSLLQKRRDHWKTSGSGTSRGKGLEIQLSQSNSAECMVAADMGIIKSGTSTLEAGLLGCPHVVVYKPSPSTGWLFKNLVRYRGPVGLVNLVAGVTVGKDFLVPEILCEKVTPAALSNALMELFCDPKKQAAMKEGFKLLKKKVYGDSEGASPSRTAAREILSVVQKIRKGTTV